MQSLAVICPLEISPGDRRWIEGVRARHDPQYGRVEPHFTLVFPLQGVAEATIARRVESLAAATPAIAFTLNAARVTPDTLAPGTHLFLMPDEGEPAIRALHDGLYQAELAASLRTDMPYAPHVTVGAFEQVADAETACAEIGRFEITGHLRAMRVMSVEGVEIRALREVPLR
jgi:2'-5' RNA ligase